nr:metal-dependent hydrolase [Bacilli bacterium]
MLSKTHQAFGLSAVAYVLVNYTHTPILSVAGIGALAVSLATSIIPDCDLAGSMPSKAFFPYTWVLEVLRLDDHRGFTHSILAAAPWWVLAYFSQPWRVTIGPIHFSFFPIVVGAAVGYSSHIVIDLLNKKGEQLFFPLKPRFALHFCSAEGFWNRAFEYLSLIAFFGLALWSIGLTFPPAHGVFVALMNLSHTALKH